MNRSRIDIKTADGIADCHAFHPSGTGPWPAILFYMDGLGLRGALFDMAARFASHGYYVLLPNMFYRSGPFAPFDAATVFKGGGPEMDRLMALVRSVDFAAAMRDTRAFLDALEREPLVTAAKVGCVGYCLGGGFSVTAAGTYPDRVAAAASLHGSRLATDAPDSPHLLAERMRGTLYIGVAEVDRNHTPEVTRRLEAALDRAGVAHTIEVYPGVAHGFAVDDTPPYDRAAAERHWERVLDLFRKTLAPS
jgi:carboxymethylenebutenolidase